jgi:phytoene synthase
VSDEDDLDALVRRVDPDRWLASRFIAEPVARADVIALYALNYELSRAADVATQPLVGEMRIAWWREAVDEVFEGRTARRHPVVLALEDAAKRAVLPRERLEAMIDARLRDLEPWPLEPPEVEPYVDRTAGALMALAAGALAPEADPHAVRHAARAWGLAGLQRLGRLPAEWSGEEVIGRVDRALAEARRELAGLPVRAFPAVAYAALARAYAGGRTPSELGRRARLTLAAARGRV